MNVTSENITERLDLIDQLKSFLASAPDGQEEPIKQHELLSGESVSCVKWNDSFYISGTDIVRCLIFRFQAFGRPIQHLKKFEEGIFSDLRNLKPGTDAILEEPKSAFLDLLFQNNCIRTQKKQKVFFWYSVPHDRLFLDALERDLKREKMGIEPTSVAMAHPALAISLDTTQAMFDNFRKSVLSELNLGPYYHQANSPASSVCVDDDTKSVNTSSPAPSDTTAMSGNLGLDTSQKAETQKSVFPTSTIFGQFSLFEGSPTYKQRRRRVTLKSQQKKQQQITNQPEKGSTSSNSNSRESSTNGESSVAWNNSFDNYTDDEIHTTRHFHCPLPACDKVFKRLEHMKRHLRTHTMERPYMCDLCGKRFSRSDNLSQHKKTHDRRKLKKIPSSSGVKKSGDSKESGSGSTKSTNNVSGYLSKSINTSFPARQQRSLGTRQSRNSDPTYSQNTTRRSTLSPSTRGRALNRSRLLRRNIQLRQRQHRTSGDDVEVMYDTANWSDHHDNSELLKVPDYEEEVKPELSISTASSSTASSCDTSPKCTRLPTIKIEDVDTYYDNQPHQQMEDTAMFMVEEYMPQQQQHGWEDESASDWQRRVDWNQYSPKATADDGEEEFHTSYSSNPYYLHQPYSHYDVSCLTSPTMISSFLFDASNTSTSNSTATTVASSPTIRPSEYHPPHYFSDESPTITPSDALLQRY